MNKLIKKLICFTVLVAVITAVALTVVACDKKTEEQDGKDRGIYVEWGQDSASGLGVALKSDKSRFDVDNAVMMYLYFGWRPTAEAVICANNYGALKHIVISASTEGSEKSAILSEYDNMFFNNYYLIAEGKYVHWETVVFPAELFTETTGTLNLSVTVVDYGTQICPIRYEVKDGFVKLSRI